MQCYLRNNVYPFKLFRNRGLERIDFEPITVFYGSNGSGKSTLLNVIAGKLGIEHTSPFNNAPCMPDYIERCRAELCPRVEKIPRESRLIASDDVFNFLLDIRSINDGVENRRQELFAEYKEIKDTLYAENPFRSIEDLEDLRRRNEAKHKTMSQFTAKRMPTEMRTRSNGESAYAYFISKITEGGLFLLDEPENSLSAERQAELAAFIEDSVRFYNCQFIISSHSPFILSIKSARIYNLDAMPCKVSKWSELGAVRSYYELFKSRIDDFD